MCVDSIEKILCLLTKEQEENIKPFKEIWVKSAYQSGIFSGRYCEKDISYNQFKEQLFIPYKDGYLWRYNNIISMVELYERLHSSHCPTTSIND